MLSRITTKVFIVAALALVSKPVPAIEPCHKGVPRITLEQGNFAKAPGTMDPDAETLHPNGKLQEQRWHNLHAAIRPLRVICHYANKDVVAVLPDTIDTCVWEHDERLFRCF